MKKKIINIGVAATLIAASGWKLYSNMDAQAQVTEFVSRRTIKFPVKTAIAKYKELAKALKSEGRIHPFKELALKSETIGKVSRIYKKKGDWVKQGDLILQTENSSLYARLLAAEANHKQNKHDLSRYEELFRQEAITQQQLEQAQVKAIMAESEWVMAKKRYQDSRITAPIDGMINEDYFEVGELLANGAPVCDLVNNSQVKLKVKLAEQEINRISEGQTVRVKVPLFPDETINAEVLTVAVKADDAYRYEVVILIQNPEGKLRSGMFASCEFDFEPQRTLVIPREALVDGFKSPKVYVYENGKVKMRKITVRPERFGDDVAVTNGLREGQSVVTDGIFNLKDGMDVEKI
ncbi:MexH family multidrug efflux RND transporter periplasmic adaptor subunit (plasmid) [Fulvitalea axinellae]|uniref:MexH family multidrug efflux RND transporter periplasmic adaptor subunit n=1 Tax=Fulvitalea axinellae TaxID=1182444 RepID=A0AAU9DJW2_9BACT|nr:MexH family multidrug efflux RND transporter periplasmic adaptor subunit [Fulvitalea axinellae]